MEPKAFESGLNPVEALSALTQLTALRLQKSPAIAANLPRWMQLDSLVCLDLSFCELLRVPVCLYAASALQDLNLGCNRLLRTPAATQVILNAPGLAFLRYGVANTESQAVLQRRRA